MSTEKQLTFEDVNAHVEKHLTTEKLHALTTTAPNLCNIYVAGRPILVILSQLPILPQKWRDGIKALIQALDVLCPQK